MTNRPSRAAPIAGGSAAIAGILALAVGIIKPWEGRELAPYLDIVNVLTVCDGITGPEVIAGKVYTPDQCDRFLSERIGITYAALERCIVKPVHPASMAAVLSMSFNVGTAAVCRSTMVRRINAGEPASAWCGEFAKWVYAGGRRVKGLVNRRNAEMKLCLQGAVPP